MDFVKLAKDLYQSPKTTIDNFRWVPGVTPFSSIYTPLFSTFGYLAIVYLLSNFMKNRKEIKLRGLAIVHNLFLSALSLVMFLGIFVPIAKDLIPEGFYSLCCKPLDYGSIQFTYYVFYLSKIYEFIDTFIQVLRKKKLMFLHVYHHFITLWLVWINLNDDTGVQWADISFNCFVHIVMYYYYFQTELGNSPWWKKYITTIQIIQFVLDMTFHIAWHFYDWVNIPCAGTFRTSMLSNLVILSFLGLFIHFYIQSYKRKPQSKPKTN